MSLGDRLKERRLLLNLSRKELSEMTYVTPQALANYENGVSIPKFEILTSLFKALECDANYLYQDYLETFPREELHLTEHERELITKYRQLNDHGKSISRMLIDAQYEHLT